MARITIEDCLKTGYNKFMLVHLAVKRVVQFRNGKEPLLTTTNKEIVTALREIAAEKIIMKQNSDLIEDYELKEDLIGTNAVEDTEIPDNQEGEEISQNEQLSDTEE